MSKTKQKGLLSSAGNAIGAFAGEFVFGTEKVLEAAGEKLSEAKKAIVNLTHKKTPAKKAVKKAVKKASKKIAKKVSRKASSKKVAVKKATKRVTRKKAAKKKGHH